MRISRKYIRRFIGKPIQCHTHFGAFHGVVVHCTKTHLILGLVRPPHRLVEDDYLDSEWRYMPMGPGPGYGGGYGGGGYGGGGGGWQFAVPLAAILGITAIGLHWW